MFPCVSGRTSGGFLIENKHTVKGNYGKRRAEFFQPEKKIFLGKYKYLNLKSPQRNI